MNRVLSAVLVILVAPSLFAFDPVHRTGNRVLVLRSTLGDDGQYESRAAARVREQLIRELRDRGFDATDARMTYDQFRREGQLDADFIVELAPGEAEDHAVAEGGVRVPNATVDIAVVVSRVASELRVYDGRTLDVIAKRHLQSHSTTVIPTGVGAGTYRMGVFVAMPFVEYFRYRAAVNAVVDDAADQIDALRR